jgi:hypothetical protein
MYRYKTSIADSVPFVLAIIIFVGLVVMYIRNKEGFNDVEKEEIKI